MDSVKKDDLIQFIEDFDDNVKIIDFDNKFQNCIECGEELSLRSVKSFALDNEGEFSIIDSNIELSEKELDFYGKYFGYYCKKCSKQINKFIIFENNADLEESLIKEILEDHTNDLTVFINDTYSICPLCSEKLQVLGESSECPKCRKGVLELTNQTFID